MKTLITSLVLFVLALGLCPGAHAAVGADGKERWNMAPEIDRGSREVLNCSYGKTSDKEIADCISEIVDKSIQKETDTLPFLMGAYFAGWARLTASTPTPGVKEKWMKICYGHFSVMQKEAGLEDIDLINATGIYDTGLQTELDKARQGK